MSASVDLKVSDIELNFLPYIYEIIRGIEKHSTDVTKSSQEISQQICELHTALEKSRAQINSLPGVECSRAEQLRRLNALQNQLQLKQQLIERYQNLSSLQPPAADSCNNQQLPATAAVESVKTLDSV